MYTDCVLPQNALSVRTREYAGSIFSSLGHFRKQRNFFSLGYVDNLSSKQIAGYAKCSGYKEGETVQNTSENNINDPQLYILTTLETGNSLTDDLLHSSTLEIENFTVKDSLPRKWTKKDVLLTQHEKVEFENTEAAIDIDLGPPKIFLISWWWSDKRFLRTIKNIRQQ